jgi:hypothetical protein
MSTKARLCFALGKYTGAGRTEISRIAPKHVKDSVIEIPAPAKDRRARHPVAPSRAARHHRRHADHGHQDVAG